MLRYAFSVRVVHCILSGKSNCVSFLQKFFVQLTVLPIQRFKFAYPIFRHDENTVYNAYQHLVPNDNFHCQNAFEKAKFDLFDSEKCQLVANTVRLMTWESYSHGMHFSAILSNYNGMTACICRRIIPTTGFLLVYVTYCFLLLLLFYFGLSIWRKAD